jgi:hypothetical protein
VSDTSARATHPAPICFLIIVTYHVVQDISFAFRGFTGQRWAHTVCVAVSGRVVTSLVRGRRLAGGAVTRLKYKRTLHMVLYERRRLQLPYRASSTPATFF